MSSSSALPATGLLRRRFGNVTGGLKAQRRLARYMLPYWRLVAVALGIALGSVLAGLAKPWPTKILVDDVLGGGSFMGLTGEGALVVAVAGTLLVFVSSAGLGLLQTRVVFGLAQRLIEDLRAQLFTHLTRLSLRYHDRQGTGDSTYRVTTDTQAVQSVLLNGLLPTVTAVLTLVATLVVMVSLDPWLTLLALTSTPGALYITGRFGSRIKKFSHTYAERESEVFAHAEQALSGIRTVQAFAREPYESGRFRTRAAASREAMMRLVTLQTVFGIAVSSVLALGLALVTWLAAKRALSGEMTTGEVLVFITYAGSLYAPVSGLSSVFADLQQAAAGAERVFTVLDEPVPTDPDNPVELNGNAKGRVRFHNVWFSYAKGQPVLRKIDFEVAPGRLVALVGPTGAGKSTIASLMLRLYDPTRGRVSIDDVSLHRLPLIQVRDQVAFVPQEPVLFPTSVRENIRYGRLDATDEEVEQAARDANVLDELLADHRGLDTPLGDRGATLSGGQRQRVAIARAFLKDSPVVLLDEPTSALDANTEASVMQAVDRLTKDRTTIVIAHRLATVHRADRVLVVDDGRIVQAGTHRQLIRRQGLYRELHDARFNPNEIETVND